MEWGRYRLQMGYDTHHYGHGVCQRLLHPGEYKLKCDYNTELLSRDRADCSLDVPGLANDRSFDCPIINRRVRSTRCCACAHAQQAVCDYARLALPAEAEPRVRLLLDTWCARE